MYCAETAHDIRSEHVASLRIVHQIEVQRVGSYARKQGRIIKNQCLIALYQTDVVASERCSMRRNWQRQETIGRLMGLRKGCTDHAKEHEQDDNDFHLKFLIIRQRY